MTHSATVTNVRVKFIRPKYRDLEEWMLDPGNVYIGRARVVFKESKRYPTEASKWANPFLVTDKGREEACDLYEEYIRHQIETDPVKYNIEELRGKNLGCWCKPASCHGDVLTKLLKEKTPHDEYCPCGNPMGHGCADNPESYIV